MNIQYIKFIRRFAVDKAQLDTAADMLIIGLNLAGTLVGAASTKGILAAIRSSATLRVKGQRSKRRKKTGRGKSPRPFPTTKGGPGD